MSHFIPHIIPSVYKYANNAIVERVLLRAVAFLTEDEALAIDLCKRHTLLQACIFHHNMHLYIWARMLEF